VTVHAIFCPVLAEFDSRADLWCDLAWAPDASGRAANLARIEMTLANRPGTLGAICSLIGEQRANIDNLDIPERCPDFYRVFVNLEVRDVKHLSDILTSVQAQEFVGQARRVTEDGPHRRVQIGTRDNDRAGGMPAAQH